MKFRIYILLALLSVGSACAVNSEGLSLIKVKKLDRKQVVSVLQNMCNDYDKFWKKKRELESCYVESCQSQAMCGLCSNDSWAINTYNSARKHAPDLKLFVDDKHREEFQEIISSLGKQEVKTLKDACDLFVQGICERVREDSNFLCVFTCGLSACLWGWWLGEADNESACCFAIQNGKNKATQAFYDFKQCIEEVEQAQKKESV